MELEFQLSFGVTIKKLFDIWIFFPKDKRFRSKFFKTSNFSSVTRVANRPSVYYFCCCLGGREVRPQTGEQS